MANTSLVRKGLPSAIADGAETSNWADRYGAQIVQPMYGAKHAFAEQGCYFVGTNPTPATGIAITSSGIAFDEAANSKTNCLLVKNTEVGTGNASKRVYLDFLRIRNVTGAPTSATDWYMVGVLDYSATRYTSGGSQITPVNVNGDSSLASIATVYFGALVCAIPASRRLLFNLLALPRLMIIKDQITIIFGKIEGDVAPVNSAAIMSVSYGVPPCVIGPNQNFVLHMYGSACAAASQFEFEMGWWEK